MCVGEILDTAWTFILVHLILHYLKSTQYMGLKVFNSLPAHIKDRQKDVNEFNDL
jgi:hypothetical protein